MSATESLQGADSLVAQVVKDFVPYRPCRAVVTGVVSDSKHWPPGHHVRAPALAGGDGAKLTQPQGGRMSNGDDFVEGQVAQRLLDSTARIETALRKVVRDMATFREEVAAANAAQAAATQALKDELDGSVAALATVQAEVEALAATGVSIPPSLQASIDAANAAIAQVGARVDDVQAGVTDIRAQVDAAPAP